MRTKWMVSAKKADFAGLAAELDTDQVVVRIMRNRGLTTASEMRDFLNKGCGVFHDPGLLPDMDKAVDIILRKIRTGASIRIIGDYDVDGVTSTTILYKGLAAIGGRVSFAIPNRMTDGYGINENMIERAHDDGVDTIVTCDNGIAAKEAIAKAVGYGMTVIVTDHHEIPYAEEAGSRTYIYPEADVLMDPKIPDCGYPEPGICGAMVAYKLMLALNDGIGRTAGSMGAVQAESSADSEARTDAATDAVTVALMPESLLEEMKELAALGTVCDVMPLMGENRTVVSAALVSMNDSRNIGIRALRRVCGTEDKPMSVYEMGFIIGPCINATGRLDTADLSVELLLSDNMEDAAIRATELKNLNELRKGYTEQGEAAAIEYIENEGMQDDKVMMVYLPTLHESLAGIVAGRIKERYYRPVIVFTDSEDGIKGSGRSIESYNMYDELNKCRELYTKFGGHAMAAGLSLPRENLERLRDGLAKNCTLTEADLVKKVLIDVPMPLGYVTEELIGMIGKLEPFGNGNPKPVFADKDLKITEVREMGKTGDMCRLTVQDNAGRRHILVLFSGYRALLEEAESRGHDGLTGLNVETVYYPEINEYNGRRSIQFLAGECRIS